jgi:hypothetical protein
MAIEAKFRAKMIKWENWKKSQKWAIIEELLNYMVKMSFL